MMMMMVVDGIVIVEAVEGTAVGNLVFVAGCGIDVVDSETLDAARAVVGEVLSAVEAAEFGIVGCAVVVVALVFEASLLYLRL